MMAPEDIEQPHCLAEALAHRPSATAAWPRRGAPDCGCPTHLCYFDRHPRVAALSECAGNDALQLLPVGEEPA